MTHQSDRVPARTLARFKRWFWRRPRPHGDTILDRRVSPLESLWQPFRALSSACLSQSGVTTSPGCTELQRMGQVSLQY
jgi:hypothetical protein